MKKGQGKRHAIPERERMRGKISSFNYKVCEELYPIATSASQRQAPLERWRSI
jgi:hypothetical protein